MDRNAEVLGGGRGALAYAESVCVYLAFSISKLLDRCCSLVTWFPQRDSIYHAFGRQALPMTWDFAEANPLADGAGSFINTIKWEAEVIESFRGRASGVAHQAAAQEQQFSNGKDRQRIADVFSEIDGNACDLTCLICPCRISVRARAESTWGLCSSARARMAAMARWRAPVSSALPRRTAAA